MPPATSESARARLRRACRRAGAGILAFATAATIGSFAYNAATGTPPPRPAGLLMVRAGGFDTRYRVWGSRGRPVVLVPGAFETADAFAALGPALAVTHRVYAIDLTGTGYSTPSPPFDAAHLAAQLLAFLRAMHLSGGAAPVLVGHSSGAAVVGMAVLADPHAAAGMVFLDGDATPLAGPSFLGWVLVNPFRTTLVRLALSQGWLVQRIYESQCGPACRPLSAAGIQTWRGPLQQPGFLQVVGYELAGHGIPSMTLAQLRGLHGVGVPKLVVYGRADPQMSPADAAMTAARIGARAPVEVPGRHLTMVSSPWQVAAAVNSVPAVR